MNQQNESGSDREVFLGMAECLNRAAEYPAELVEEEVLFTEEDRAFLFVWGIVAP